MCGRAYADACVCVWVGGWKEAWDRMCAKAGGNEVGKGLWEYQFLCLFRFPESWEVCVVEHKFVVGRRHAKDAHGTGLSLARLRFPRLDSCHPCSVRVPWSRLITWRQVREVERGHRTKNSVGLTSGNGACVLCILCSRRVTLFVCMNWRIFQDKEVYQVSTLTEGTYQLASLVYRRDPTP
jgi:hypothetical protein